MDNETILNESERAYCCKCESIQRCRVTRDSEMTRWRCLQCNMLCDEEYNDVLLNDEEDRN